MKRDFETPTDGRDSIAVGDLLIDLHAKVAHLAGHVLDLTAREFQLLMHLAQHPGWVYSPEQLLRDVWGYEYVEDCRPVYTHMGNLRRKLRQYPPGRDLISTVRGVGYRLEKPEQPAAHPPLPSTGDSAAPSAGDRAPGAPLLGRDREMALLADHLEQARRGCGSLVLLVGEAGQGKTRLVVELEARAVAAGATTLWARCQEATLSSAFWPWIQVLRPLVRASAKREPQPGLTHSLGELAAIVPETGEYYPGLPSAQAPLLVDTRTRFFDAVATFLSSASRDAPLLLVLEDLDYCDQESLLLLQALAPQLEGSALLIIGTLDAIAIGRDRPLSHAVSALTASGCTSVRLSGLAEAEVAELIRLSTGREVSPALVETLVAKTAGNPLFVLELLRSLAGSGELERTTGNQEPATPVGGAGSGAGPSLPRAILSVVEARLSHISHACRELLSLAALLGRSFRLPILQTACGLPPAEVVDLLDEALVAELIEPAGPPGSFQFNHPLLREALIAYVGEAHRLRLHADACAAYETLFETGEVLDELAYHSYHASPFVDGGKAVGFSRRAGERALQRYGFEVAGEHFGHALVLLPLDGSSAERRQLAAAELREGLGDACSFSARLDEALAAYREAIALTLPDDRLRRARLRRKSASVWQARQEPAAALDSLDAAERVLLADPALEPEEWTEWIEIQLRRMESLYFQGDLRGLEGVIDRSAGRIAEHATAAQRLDLRTHQLALEFRRERYRLTAGTDDLARDLLRTVVATDDVSRLCHATYQLGFALLWRGSLDESRHYLRECREEAVRTHDRRHLVLVDTYLAVLERLAGRALGAERWAHQAETEAEEASLPGYVAAAKANLAWVALCRGDPAAAEASARRALTLWGAPSAFPFEWLARWPLLHLALKDDNIAGATEQASAMLSGLQQPLPPAVADALAQAVAAWDWGDTAAAARALNLALDKAPAGYGTASANLKDRLD